jgi:hypothetical protein
LLRHFFSISALVANQNKESISAKWNLVWSDEFNGPQLDTSKRVYDIGGGKWGHQMPRSLGAAKKRGAAFGIRISMIALSVIASAAVTTVSASNGKGYDNSIPYG